MAMDERTIKKLRGIPMKPLPETGRIWFHKHFNKWGATLYNEGGEAIYATRYFESEVEALEYIRPRCKEVVKEVGPAK